jgi:hypothetical protein
MEERTVAGVGSPGMSLLLAWLALGAASCGSGGSNVASISEGGDASPDGIGSPSDEGGADADLAPPGDAGSGSADADAGNADSGGGDADSAVPDAARAVAIGSLDGGASEPAAVIDDTNARLLVAAKSNATGKPVLYRCDYGGTSCTVTDISAGQSTQSDVHAALMDPTASKLLVVAADGSFTPALYRCNLDGTGCSHATLSSNRILYGMSAVVDGASSKLLVASADDANGKAVFIRCALDGTGCSFADLSATGDTGASLAYPSVVLDSASSKVLMPLIAQTTAGAAPALYRCALDGTSCTYADLSAGHLYTTNNVMLSAAPSGALDAAGAKLLVVGCYDSLPGLARCATDGTGCTYTDISQGHAALSVRALVDAVRSKLVVVALDSPSYEPSVRECNLDGTACVYTSLVAGPATPEIYDPTAVLDPGGAALYAVGSGVLGGALYEFTSSL